MNVALTAVWRVSATAASFTSRSFTVGFASPSAMRSTSFSRSASASVMSAETPSWKTGAVQASVRRRAIVLRTEVSCTTSTSPGGIATGAIGAGAPAAARSTSSARIRPSGPVPWIDARSTPRSRAILRASGLAFTRPTGA